MVALIDVFDNLETEYQAKYTTRTDVIMTVFANISVLAHKADMEQH